MAAGLPVIPLGVDAQQFDRTESEHELARSALGLAANTTVFLFAGRLSFHAKANPAALYQALQSIANKSGPITCIEAGVFPNTAVQAGFRTAHAALAPDVSFVWVDGNDSVRYRQAWQAADVFVSLSDNIQETFGLTPVEAMAAGLPVIVADWDGYKDTVRDGIDGYRVPTVIPPAGIGSDLALRHALGLDTYDYFIGRASMATVVEPIALAAACFQLASNPALRRQMGEAGQRRALAEYDWSVILRRYEALANELNEIREAASGQSLVHSAQAWPERGDPFHRFAHYPTAVLQGHWRVAVVYGAQARLSSLLSLSMLNYAFAVDSMDAALVERLLGAIGASGSGPSGGTQACVTVQTALVAAGCSTPAGVRALMWLWKFGLVNISPVT
jgi:hypothetical protein